MVTAWRVGTRRPRGRGRLRRKQSPVAIFAPGEVIFSLFSLLTPRFDRPAVFRRASKSMRDWENELEGILAFLPVNMGDPSVTTVFEFTGRCCSACGIKAGAVETIDV